MLHGETLQALLGELAGAELGKKTRVHQLFHAWIDHLTHDAFDELVRHRISLKELK
jgi:hypothetical protein